MTLEHAFDRLDAFQAVQGDRMTVEAVNLLQEAVGIDDDARRLLLDRLPHLSQQANPGAVLLGLLLGLFAADPD